MAMEISFPMCSSYRLKPYQLAGNTRFMKRICNMLPLQMTSQTCEKLIFHSGSRAEGLTLRVGWGHEEPDCDVMYTFSRLWGVPLQAPGNYTKALLASLMTAEPIGGIIALETGDAPPGFCRLRVYGDHGKMAEYMRSFGVRYTYPHVGRKRRMCIVERGGAHWISPKKVADLMLEERCIFRAKESVSPATVLKGGWVENVPTLLLSQSLPFMKTYLTRYRSRTWPTAETLSEISRLPTLFVAAGHKLSANRDIEWRLSCSHAEYILCNTLPVWVKQAFCAFKYIIKRLDLASAVWERSGTNHDTSQQESPEGRSKLCSFHLKMTLFWELEKTDAWKYESSFYLLLRLFDALLKFLTCGNLPHYFIPNCNLLQCVADREKNVATHHINECVRDPIGAILMSPKYPRQIYGCEDNKNVYVDEQDIIAGFRILSQAITDSSTDVDTPVMFLRRLCLRLDKHRDRRYQLMLKARVFDSTYPLINLFNVLIGIKTRRMNNLNLQNAINSLILS